MNNENNGATGDHADDPREEAADRAPEKPIDGSPSIKAGRSRRKAKDIEKSAGKEHDQAKGGGRGMGSSLNGFTLAASDIEVVIDDIEPCDVRERYNQEFVFRYCQNYRDGVPMPNVILMRDREGRLRTVDGNHRIRGRLLNGDKTVMADIYLGELEDAKDCGLDLNRHGVPLESRDFIKRLQERIRNGETVNISEFARRHNLSRSAIYQQWSREPAAGGYAAQVRKMRLPKSPDEKAGDMARRVVKMVEDGFPQVIDKIFEQLDDHTRVKLVARLRQQYGGGSDS